MVQLWRENLSKVNQKAAESLADPTEYENLFPGLKEAFVAEEWVKETHADLWPAKQYPLVTVSGPGGTGCPATLAMARREADPQLPLSTAYQEKRICGT